MAQLSDDCFAQGGRLMRVEEALDLLARSVVRVTESEPMALAAALGGLSVPRLDLNDPGAIADFVIGHCALAGRARGVA